MLEKLRPRSLYDVMSLVACVTAIGTGTAYAANTIGSSDIIDESILSVDIKNGAVGNQDIAVNSVSSSRVLNESLVGNDVLNDSLTGADIAESTLGKVNDADTVDGLDSSQLVGEFVGVQRGGNFSDGCTVADEWRECAPTTVNVPAGKTYQVMIDSAGSYFSAVTNKVRICSSARLSTVTPDPTAPEYGGCAFGNIGFAIAAGGMEAASTNGHASLTGGPTGASYVVSTAVRPDAGLSADLDFDHARTRTLATIMDITLGSPSAAPFKSDARR